ncbi:MAG: hypothetical protein K9N46_14650 [Candidatus Marinimicrobia bacterium]|nr:hypothetical protein [Candidatus Neomarinimicrobiota bacterium]MCF7828479.1 hypothetical protein [Candidatus Neomarinimicrobiota bacterium]MCF7881969.1 hypothetical protein [Candidatus Neomarinimicrobiota bacterium]
MSINFRVLGEPFGDNALFAEVDSGEMRRHLLFDCGGGCLNAFRPSEIMVIDHLCFSHFHLDHIAGFDRFLRMNYNRESNPVRVWGPEGAADIIGHRLQGVSWDLIGDSPTVWRVTDIAADSLYPTEFYAREEFRRPHPMESKQFDSAIIDESSFTVHAVHLSHRTPSIAYYVEEPPRWNIDKNALDTLQLQPGEWLEEVKDFSRDDAEKIESGGKERTLGELREILLRKKEGATIAYVTDCVFEGESTEKLVRLIAGVDTLICESTYAAEDEELAAQNYHLTSKQAAEIARQSDAGQLVLIHMSERYQDQGPEYLRDQASDIFENTVLPEAWE